MHSNRSKYVLFAVLAIIAVSAFAADSVVYPAKNGNVTFPHKKHADAMACTSCHETEKGGKIAALGKDWAHKTCKGCHADRGKGPTKCSECHVK